MSTKILLVDDEPVVLDGYARTLHRDFEVHVSVGAELGLAMIAEKGPFAVVISDMRMPGMNGAQFLAKVRELSPDTVRMLLTGYTELNASMQAVNEGHIFRFLTKPCPKEVLIAAIDAGVEQYQLIRAEKDLLEHTLLGSIKVLADFLSVSSPEAFGRSLRIVHFVRHIAAKVKFPLSWRLEAAATLSQLGCVTLDADVLQKALVGMSLSNQDQARFEAHPQAAMRLLTGIPRLEPTAWMIGQQLVRNIPLQTPTVPASIMKETVFGATILKLAVAFDDLRSKSISDEDAIIRLHSRNKEFDRELVEALSGIKLQHGRMEARRLNVSKLGSGMILGQEVRSREGMLLVAKGQEITLAVLMKIENYTEAGLTEPDFIVLVPM